MNSLLLSLRLLFRQARSGALLTLIAALAVAAGALTAVGQFTDRVDRALTRSAGELLGADLVVTGRNALPETYRTEARARGLRTAEVVTFSTVIFSDETSLLVDVKAVGEGYPLRGRLRLAGEASPVGDRIPAPGTAWPEPRAMRALAAEPGDRLDIGRAGLEITEALEYEPDRGGGLYSLAPRVMINLADLDATGLMAPGARASYRLLLAGSESAIADFRTWLAPRLEDNQRLRTVADAQERTGRALEQARRFLGMAALTAVILAAVAALMAARRFSHQQRDLVALLKCLGTTSRGVILSVGGLLLWSVALALVIGGVCGGLGQQVIALITAESPAGTLPPARMAPVGTAAAVTAVLALGFALPPLAALGRVPPMRILNRSLDSGHAGWRLATAAAVICALAIPAWQLQDARLAAILLGGSAALAITLALAGMLAMWATRRLASGRGPAWRIGLSGLHRRRANGLVQITALGLGLMALLLLVVVRGELLDQWRASLPADAPNHFLINIQPDQVTGVGDLLAGMGAGNIQLRPMASGRLLAVNGKAPNTVDVPDEDGRRWLDGQINLSWTPELPPANRVTEGVFDVTDRQAVSLARRWSERTGVGLGDVMRLELGTHTVELPVTSIREVEWDSFNVNFFVLISPQLAVDLPHQVIGSFHLPPGASGNLRQLSRRFPNVSILDTGAILERLRRIIARVSQAAQVVFLFTLAAGVVVMVIALQSARDERRSEAALLRTLGGGRGLIQGAFLIEHATMALIAGGLAAGGAAITGGLLASELFGFAYRPSPWLAGLGLGAGLLLVVGTGWLSNRRVLATPPIRMIRT